MIGSVEVVEDKTAEGSVENLEVVQGEESISIKHKRVNCTVEKKNSLRARYVYGFIFLLTNLFAWFIRDYGQKVLPELHCKLCLFHCTNV